MANEKQTKLSIVVRTVDQATARLKAINDRLNTLTKPMRDFRKQLSDLRENSGLNDVIGGFKGVGSAVGDLIGKATVLGGVLAAATAGVLHIIDGFDDLGDAAERAGVGVDFLAQLRYAAKRSGAEVEQLDAGLQGFVASLGQARAGTGKLAGFLKIVSPALLKQLKAAKSNEEAFGLLADAMVKIQDPAKRAAFAQKTLGDPALAGLLARGSKGIQELRDRYAQLAGTQEGAVGAAGDFGDSMDDLHAATDGIKAALVTGLAPALKVIVERLREWLTGHREDIAIWAKQVGEKLPAAVKAVAEWIGKAFEKVRAFVDMVGGLKNVAIGAAAIIAGPLLLAITNLGLGIGKVISRLGALRSGLGGLHGAAGAAGAGGGAGGLAFLGPAGLAIAGAGVLNELTGGSIGEANGLGYFGTIEAALKQRQADRAGRWQQLLGMRPDVSGQVNSLVAPRAQKAEASVSVKFEGAPKGMRVAVDPQSTADVDFTTGYLMGFPP